MTQFNWQNPYPTPRMPVFARNIVSTSHPLAAQAADYQLQGDVLGGRPLGQALDHRGEAPAPGAHGVHHIEQATGHPRPPRGWAWR